MSSRLIRPAIVLIIAAVAVVASGYPGRAQQVSAELASKAPEAATIASLAQTDGHVRVIVLFTGQSIVGQFRPSATIIASAKARVAALQDSVLASHFASATAPRPGRGFARHLARFDITPGFAINVDSEELAALAADPLVRSISYDRPMPPTLLQSLPLIGQPTAYTNGATGAGWAVAVLDTGVQSNHEFLNGKVVAEACFSNAAGIGGGVSLCPNGLTSQTGTGAADSITANCINGSTNLCQHGTHVSGIAAGFNTSQSAGEPTNGVARDGKIFAIQIFTRFNTRSTCGGAPPCLLSYSSDQILALDYVYQHLTPVTGVNVASINMSLGGGPDTATACDTDSQKPAIDNLRAAGVLTAIAAGNDGSTGLISHPACISSAVAVGSTTKSDAVSSFSNMANIVAVLAPGGLGGGTCTLGGNNSDILSSYPGIASATTNLYACEAGTSMATPHVAGAIAALRSAMPNATAAQLLSALETTGIAIADTRSGGTITKPRIRVDLALQSLQNTLGALKVSPPTNISSAGQQGGPFSPLLFSYAITATLGSRGYTISGVPTWLTASSTSGTATTSGTTITFAVNSNANALSPATYNATITFTDTTSNMTALTVTAALTVNVLSVLQVSPAAGIAGTGIQGGPFSPSSFQYQLSTNSGAVSYSISGVPNWLDASSTSGTATTSATTVTFTVNASANSLSAGGYNATIAFANTTNGQGDQSVNATLTVGASSSSGGSPSAQTWVSGLGNDSADCSRATPCLTFAGALAKTTAGGTINCLDLGDFGGVTITTALTIACDYTEGGVSLSNNSGIVVNAGVADVVSLSGLDLDGQGTATNGISYVAGEALMVSNSIIRDFTNAGILFAPNAGASQLQVFDTTVEDNGGSGILIKPTGSGAVRATIDGVRAFNNAANGVAADATATSGSIAVVATDSAATQNAGAGFAAASSGVKSAVTITDSAAVGNTIGITASGSGAVARFADDTVTRNTTGISQATSGVALSYGTNSINGNTVDGVFGTASLQ